MLFTPMAMIMYVHTLQMLLKAQQPLKILRLSRSMIISLHVTECTVKLHQNVHELISCTCEIQ